MGRNQRSYYAVQKGKQQGVFATWDECKSNVSGYSGAKYKKFATLEEAQSFANQGSSTSSTSSSNNSYYSSANQGSSTSSSNNSYYSSANRSSTPTSTSNNNYYSYVTSHSPSKSSPRPKVNHSPKPTITHTTYAAANIPTIKQETTSYTAAIKRERSWNDDYDTPPSKTIKTETVDTKQPSTAASTKGHIVYTDGASRGNGSKRAKAGYGVWWGDGDPRNSSGPLESGKQTNQRAEATAILKVLQQAQDMPEQLEIRTDSQYCIKAMTEWHKKWQKNGWKSSTGNPVENKDLFEPMLELVKLRKGETAFVYVPGHKGFYGNEQADALAVAGAQSRVKKEKK